MTSKGCLCERGARAHTLAVLRMMQAGVYLMSSPVVVPYLPCISQSPLLELVEDSDWRVAQAQWVQGTVPRRNRRLLELTHGAGHDIACPQRPEVCA